MALKDLLEEIRKNSEPLTEDALSQLKTNLLSFSGSLKGSSMDIDNSDFEAAIKKMVTVQKGLTDIITKVKRNLGMK